MQQTTAQYNPYADARWSNIRVSFRLVDVDAAGDTTPQVPSGSRISQPLQTIEELEGTEQSSGILLCPGAWPLDGSMASYPVNVQGLRTGWASKVLAGEDTAFTQPQRIIFAFSKAQSSVGFTITFGDGLASVLEVAAFGPGGELLARKQVTNHNRVCVVDMPVAEYRRLEIAFIKGALPQYPIQVLEVLFGVVQHFDANNTTELQLVYEIDPTSQTQPTQQAVVTIDNLDRRYNMVSPTGIYAYLQEGQALDVALGVGLRDGVELVNMGRYYYTTSTAEDDGLTAQITAHDPLQAMTGQYRKGKRGTARMIDLLADIIADSGKVIVLDVPTEIASRVVGSNVPLVTHREAIRLVCQAARCCSWVARNDTLVVRQPEVGTPVDVLDLDKMASVPQISVEPPINTVEVSAYTLAKDFDTQQQDLVSVEQVVDGIAEIWVPLPSPAENTTARVSGAQVLSSDHYLHAVRLTLSGQGKATITISGLRLEQNETIHSYTDKRAGEPERSEQLQNALVTPEIALDVAKWALGHYGQRVRYGINERGNPARELGDTVTVYDAYKSNRDALIVRQDLDYSGGTLSASTKARGTKI